MFTGGNKHRLARALAGLAFAGLVVAAAAMMSPVAYAADTLTKIKDSHSIVMGFYNEPPHNWVEFTGGGYKGMDYDIGAAILG